MQLSNYLKIYPCPDRPGMNLVYSTLRSAVLLLPDELLQAARNGALPDQELDILAQLDILTPDQAAERQRLRTIFDTPRANTPFSAVVVLNLDCNLACPYCYEDAFRGQHYMSDATAALLVKSIRSERIAKGQPLRLTFYGGEPLLSLGLIRAIARPLGQAARERGVAFGFSLVTNGTLLNRACVEELLPLGLTGAKVTIDGP
ncbi:MAG TPA: putative geopeptide radical SAM maturase, partial [Geobacter sp.]|nr:putative geopeptide radical SAM maturase [Geobacter sp.]